MPRLVLSIPLLLATGPLPAQSLLYELYGPGPGEQLGYSVAGGVDFDRDGWDDVVVGNPYADAGGGIDNGSVCIVSGKDGTLLHCRFGSADQDHFGWSVAIAGDVDGDGFRDIAAGAPEASNGALRPGMVRVFSYETLSVLYTLYGGADGDQFGYSVGGGFDLDADGRDDFLVGAPGENLGGAAYVFSGSNGATIGGYTETIQAGARTGSSVAALGDLGGDGFPDWGAGAPGYGAGEGRVVILSHSASGTSVLKRSGNVPGGEFGTSLAGKLDLDGDGLSEYLVGAPRDSTGGAQAGRVALYEGSDATAASVWYGQQAYDRFGASLARLPDLTGDGRNEFAAGAPGTGSGPGQVRVISPFDGAELFSVQGEPGSRFGQAVARAGDFDRDGYQDLVVGGPRADDPHHAPQKNHGFLRVHSAAGPGIVTYCTAGTSASGCQAAISASGLPSATAASGFFLAAAGVEGHTPGLFFFGANGRQAAPWGNGTSFQCVVPPAKRAGLLSKSGTSGSCDGSFLQDLNARWCPSCPKAHHNFGAGAVVQAQLWYRDPDSTSNQTTSLSNAVEFVVGY